MAEDMLEQIEEVKSSPVKFCLEFDKLKDTRSCAVLLGLIRYVHLNMIKEEFLLRENLSMPTMGGGVFNTVSHFFGEQSAKLTSCSSRVSRRCTCHNE